MIWENLRKKNFENFSPAKPIIKYLVSGAFRPIGPDLSISVAHSLFIQSISNLDSLDLGSWWFLKKISMNQIIPIQTPVISTLHEKFQFLTFKGGSTRIWPEKVPSFSYMLMCTLLNLGRPWSMCNFLPAALAEAGLDLTLSLSIAVMVAVMLFRRIIISTPRKHKTNTDDRLTLTDCSP